MPTEAELSRRFGVNRHTVRRALSELEERGLVRAEQGRGTYVQEGVISYPVAKRTRFSEVIRKQEKSPKGRLLGSDRIAAKSDVASNLKIRPGARVIVLERMGLVDDVPISLATHYFPARRFDGLEEEFERRQSITAALKALGVGDYTRKETRVTTRLPTAEEMRWLGLARNRPVLVAESVNVDESGRPIEYGLARFAGDRVQIVFEP